MTYTSVNALIREAIGSTLETAGFVVFDNILEHHTGVRTRHREYIEISRGSSRVYDEIVDDKVSGEYSIDLRMYYPTGFLKNTVCNSCTFEDRFAYVCSLLSTIQIGGMYTRFNISHTDTEAPSNSGLSRVITLSCMMSTSRAFDD